VRLCRVASPAGDVPASPGDAAAALVAAVVEQRRRARGAAHHLRAGDPEQQAERARGDGGEQLLPRGRGRRVQALPQHPAHRPAVRRPGVPEARGALPSGGRAVHQVAGRAAGRVRRVRGLWQHDHLRRAPVRGAGRGAGAHRPPVPVGGAAGLHPRPQQGVAPRVPGPCRRQGHDRELVPPAAGTCSTFHAILALHIVTVRRFLPLDRCWLTVRWRASCRTAGGTRPWRG